jgi:hypothetical protein
VILKKREAPVSHPIRKTYYVMATTWTGLRRRILEIRTALAMDLDGRQARRIARQLGGHYLKPARLCEAKCGEAPHAAL